MRDLGQQLNLSTSLSPCVSRGLGIVGVVCTGLGFQVRIGDVLNCRGRGLFIFVLHGFRVYDLRFGDLGFEFFFDFGFSGLTAP